MARARNRSGGRGADASADTRSRILEATLATIRDEGILGASARAIARNGQFNQASIYYHFGSIDDAVIEAVSEMSSSRLQRYEQQLANVTSLPELVEVAADLYREDAESGLIRILSQVMAGAAGDDELSRRLGPVFEPWVETVARALRQALGDGILADALPVDDLAFAVSALFVGIELFDQVQPEGHQGEKLFQALGGLAHLVAAVLPPSTTLTSGEAASA